MTLQRSCRELCACLKFSGNQCLVSFLNFIGCFVLCVLACRCREGAFRACQRTRAVPESGQYASFDAHADAAVAKQRAEDEKKLSVLDAALGSGTAFQDPEWQIPPQGATQVISGKNVTWRNFATASPSAQLWDAAKGGPLSDDVQQGGLGDCYVLASVAALAERKKLAPLFLRPSNPSAPFRGAAIQLVDSSANPRVIAVDPMFPTLPESSSNALAFARVKNDGDGGKSKTTYLWLPAIEKAFAKLRGGNSYQAIEAGQPAMALLTLTGAAVQTVVHAELGGGLTLSPSEELWRYLIDREAESDHGGKANRDAMDLTVVGTYDDFGPSTILRCLLYPCARVCDPLAIVSCLICPRWFRRLCVNCFKRHCWGCLACGTMLWRGLKGLLGLIFGVIFWPFIRCGICARIQLWGSRGLVPGHAYSLLGVHRVPLCGGKGENCLSRCCTVRLVKLRNPHGSEGEWQGTWSDGSMLWRCVSPGVQAAIGKPQLPPGAKASSLSSDGVFFISADDLAANLASTALCRAREGWATWSVPTRVAGPSAYWIIQTPSLASASASAREGLPSPSSSSSSSSAAAASVKANPMQSNGSGKGGDDRSVAVTVHNPGGAGGGIRCALTLLHVDGATPGGALEGGQAARITVFNINTRKPVGSSRPQSYLSSFSSQAALGTDCLTLQHGQTYVVFAQWMAKDSLMAEKGGGRKVVLLLSANEKHDGLTIGVASAAPEPRLPWAPAHSAFGHCNFCGLPLPAEFCFVDGSRLHSECVAGATGMGAARELAKTVGNPAAAAGRR